MDTTTCPECGSLAEVQCRTVFESTDGPIEHARISCVRRHWFFLPVAYLVPPPPGTAVGRAYSRAAS